MLGHRRAIHRCPSTAAAFTLIELLVVMTIMALLLGLLLPVLGSARDTAKLVKCASNLRQSGTSLQAYAIDHNDRLPPPAVSNGYVNTLFFLSNSDGPYDQRSYTSDYIGSYEVWTCPSTDGVPIDDPGNTRSNGSYGVFAYMPGRSFPDFGLTNGTPDSMTNNESAAQLTMLQDEYRDDGDEGTQVYNHGAGIADTSLVGQGNPSYAGYRGNWCDGINAVFFDGHAVWLPAGELNVVGFADTNYNRQFGYLPR